MTYYKNEATLIDFLIAFIFSCRSKRIMNNILWERVNSRRQVSKNSYDRNIYRLKEKGILKINRGEIEIDKKKLNYFYKYRLIYSKLNSTSKIILIFDIPEKERKTRNWLRKQIKLWGFSMIQKSVWLGTGPLPKEFTNRVKLLNVEKCIKVFNVQSKKVTI